MDWSDDNDELAAAVDELLVAAPAVEPPAGFEDRVLDRIRAAREDRERPGRGAPDRRRRDPLRLPVWAAAAAAAVFLVVGGIGGAVVGRSGGDRVRSAAQAFRTVKLISTSGADIGEVSTLPGRPAWVYMRLEGQVPDGTYRCMLEMEDGSSVPVGRLWVLNGHGAWGEHVDVDPARARFARVLGPDGKTVASAHLG